MALFQKGYKRKFVQLWCHSTVSFGRCWGPRVSCSMDARMSMKHHTDIEFIAALTSYLAQFSEGHKPVVPLFKNADGSINRDRTLALPCYMNFSHT